MAIGGKETSADHRAAGRVLTLLGLAAILTICLVPLAEGGPRVPPQCVFCGERGTADFLLNVLLFVPFGVGVRLATGSVSAAILCSVLLSTGVELAQFWLPGRYPRLGDLLANSAGGTLAALGYGPLEEGIDPRRETSVRTHALAVGLVAAGLFLPAILFSPAVPDGVLFANWRDATERQGEARGWVREARLGTLPLPSRRIADQEGFRRLWSEGADLALSVQWRPGAAEPTSMFRIVDTAGAELLNIGVRRSDLLVHVRRRTAEVGLTDPDLTVPGAFEGFTDGDTVRIGVERFVGEADRIRVTAPDGQIREASLGLRAADGWAAVLSRGRPSPPVRSVAGHLWLALLGVAAGWWALRATHAAAAGLVVGFVLWATPSVSVLLTPLLTHYVAVMVGIVLGFVGARLGSVEPDPGIPPHDGARSSHRARRHEGT